MEVTFTEHQKQRIADAVKAKYCKAAANIEGLFKYPTGRTGLEALEYDRGIVDALPETVLSCYCGVGNPFSLGPVYKGDRILDVGCGCGVDSLVAALLTGPSGSVTGVDMNPDMLARARRNAEESGIDNVSFREADAENLPFDDGSFDVVISNGVLNLVPDKDKAVAEIFRVLKPGGHLMMADQFLVEESTKDVETLIDRWAH